MCEWDSGLCGSAETWWCGSVVREVIVHQGTNWFGGIVRVVEGNDSHATFDLKFEQPGIIVRFVVGPSYKVVD